VLGRDQAERAVLMEHTMAERFPGQRVKQLAAVELLRPLEILLTGKLPIPARYDLVADPGAVLGLKHRITEIRTIIAEWGIAVAPCWSSPVRPSHVGISNQSRFQERSCGSRSTGGQYAAVRCGLSSGIVRSKKRSIVRGLLFRTRSSSDW